MGRIIAAVVAGFVIMSVLVMGSFAVAIPALGQDVVVRPGTWEPTGTWIAISFALGLTAAVAGGAVTEGIAKDPRAIIGLVGLMLLMGIIPAVMAAMSPVVPPAAPPTPETSAAELMQSGLQPLWVSFANPIVGALGALGGSKLVRMRIARR